MNKKEGLSLTEILVGLVILSLIALGVLGIFRASKMHILHAKSRIQAANLGRLFLDYLSNDVRQDTWDASTNSLSVGNRFCDSSANPQQPGCPAINERNFIYPPVTYNALYEVDNVNENLRRVRLTISWQEIR